ncbi:MAG: hypothetical protein IH926_09100 [Proteobacteria bacterium]|nr:hypothetical protein [Pseudomonadota bacterium]
MLLSTIARGALDRVGAAGDDSCDAAVMNDDQAIFNNIIRKPINQGTTMHGDATTVGRVWCTSYLRLGYSLATE